MSKFIWKNGSQVEPAKVQIGDTSYEVTPAQYEGETPLSATNLNTMVDNTYSDLQKYCISAVNEVKGKILWTNPNPTSEITTDTQMTLSSNDYDVLKIYSRLSLTNLYMITNEVLKGYGARIYYGSNYRPINRNNDTLYTISTATDGQGNVAVPLYVVGYKTGLFD